VLSLACLRISAKSDTHFEKYLDSASGSIGTAYGAERCFAGSSIGVSELGQDFEGRKNQSGPPSRMRLSKANQAAAIARGMQPEKSCRFCQQHDMLSVMKSRVFVGSSVEALNVPPERRLRYSSRLTKFQRRQANTRLSRNAEQSLTAFGSRFYSRFYLCSAFVEHCMPNPYPET
jgi:hypothetical protein